MASEQLANRKVQIGGVDDAAVPTNSLRGSRSLHESASNEGGVLSSSQKAVRQSGNHSDRVHAANRRLVDEEEEAVNDGEDDSDDLDEDDADSADDEEEEEDDEEDDDGYDDEETDQVEEDETSDPNPVMFDNSPNEDEDADLAEDELTKLLADISVVPKVDQSTPHLTSSPVEPTPSHVSTGSSDPAAPMPRDDSVSSSREADPPSAMSVLHPSLSVDSSKTMTDGLTPVHESSVVRGRTSVERVELDASTMHATPIPTPTLATAVHRLPVTSVDPSVLASSGEPPQPAVSSTAYIRFKSSATMRGQLIDTLRLVAERVEALALLGMPRTAVGRRFDPRQRPAQSMRSFHPGRNPTVSHQKSLIKIL